jgi:hypothetical protein
MKRMLLLPIACLLLGQEPPLPPNYPKGLYDESKVPQYTLPDPLVLLNGGEVKDAGTWTQKRRPELLALFETHVYGKTMVGRPKEMTWEVVAESREPNITKTVRLYFAGKKDGPSMDLTMTLPKSGKPVPVFLIAGFGRPNQPVLDRGYGMVVANIGQIQADNPAGYANSIRAFYAPPGQKEPGPEEWGAIGAWAWGLSRAMDYLETDKDMTRGELPSTESHATARLSCGPEPRTPGLPSRFRARPAAAARSSSAGDTARRSAP